MESAHVIHKGTGLRPCQATTSRVAFTEAEQNDAIKVYLPVLACLRPETKGEGLHHFLLLAIAEITSDVMGYTKPTIVPITTMTMLSISEQQFPPSVKPDSIEPAHSTAPCERMPVVKWPQGPLGDCIPLSPFKLL
ncbi:hypothetical protein PAMP_008040 [Pampus punctatissimus]